MNEQELGDVTPPGEAVILTKNQFALEASERVRELYPDDGWHKFVDATLEKANADQRLQQKGGMYLNATPDAGRKVGVAAMKWAGADGQPVYQMMVGMQWEVQAFVNAVLNVYGKQRPPAGERAARRKAQARATKKKARK